jgi:hypothetical protein
VLSLANSLSKSFASVVCHILILDSGTRGALITCNSPEEQYNTDKEEFGRGGGADCEIKQRGGGIRGRGGRGCDFKGSVKGRFECSETSEREARGCNGLDGGLRTSEGW